MRGFGRNLLCEPNQTASFTSGNSYIGEAKTAEEEPKGKKRYELRIKAHLGMFLKENSIQDIMDQATDTQAAIILLALLNVLQTENEN